MKNVLFFMFLMIPGSLCAQVTDDFSDGNFTSNPQWTGDTDHFEVNSSEQLHLKSAGSDTSYLVTGMSLFKETEWSFWIKLSFNTSANNHARIYLVSDQHVLTASLNGYYLQIGGASDSVYFVRQNGDQHEQLLRIAQFSTGHSTNQLRFRIVRSETATWTIYADSSGNTNFMETGIIRDEMSIEGGSFGISCRYTSSNAAKIYFDDLYVGPVIRDSVAPRIQAVSVDDLRTVSLVWSEPPDIATSSDTGRYELRVTGQHPLVASPDPGNPGRTVLVFAIPLPDAGFDTLYISDIEDPSGNTMRDTAVAVCYYRAKTYDVLIHEIMADPDPATGLPAAEYAELFNNSGFPVGLHNWTLEYGSSSKEFPEITIPPRGFLILSKDSSLSSFGPFLPFFTATSSLSNEGTTLVLRDDSARIIHAVTYSYDWFSGSFKEDGGWSLEMMDPLNPCGCAENWAPSADPSGGTPGRTNSTACSNPDDSPPSLWRGIITASQTAEIVFSEPMDSSSLAASMAYELLPDGVHPEQVMPVPPDYHAVHLVFEVTFQPGRIYTVEVSREVQDCAGNRIEEEAEVILAIPGMAERNNIIINELLFDPYDDGSCFIELYNNSDIPLDLRDLSLGYSREGEAKPLADEPLTGQPWLLLPGKYVAVCRDCESVISRYPGCAPDRFLEMESLPLFSSEDGMVWLVRKADEELIDRFSYSASMHDPLLYFTEGVSLERINPLLPSMDPANWHSAAHTSGYATPGKVNSQYFMGSAAEGAMEMEPLIFSPDNDGRDDVLSIRCNLGKPGLKVSLAVYDSRGMLVRNLANTVLAEPQCGFTWDGTTNEHLRAPVGIYVIVLQAADNEGNSWKYKETAVLGVQF